MTISGRKCLLCDNFFSIKMVLDLCPCQHEEQQNYTYNFFEGVYRNHSEKRM